MATPAPEAAAPVIPAPAPMLPAPVLLATLTAQLGPLPPGTYVVHLHTTCNGGPAYHITTIGFVRGGEPMRQAGIVDFHSSLDQLC